MDGSNERSDISTQGSSLSTANPIVPTTSTETATFNPSIPFDFPGNSGQGYPVPDQVQAVQQNITGVPRQPLYPGLYSPSVQPSYHPQFMNYTFPPYHNPPTIPFPIDSFRGWDTPQASSSRFQLLAPKLPSQTHVKSTRSSHGQPPDFIETVQTIRKKLYEMGGLSESDEPLTEGNIHSKWRTVVKDEWKQHSMDHYMMVAKLSNRCFELVLQIAKTRKVTQSDFLDLYKKSESQRYDLLLDLLEGRINFEDLRKQRRMTLGTNISASKTKKDNKEVEDEIALLRSKNASLQMKMDEVLEERDKDRRKIRELTQKLRSLEREKEQEYNQYTTDVSDLLCEKKVLSESLASSVVDRWWSDADDDALGELDESTPPLQVIEDRVQEKRSNVPQKIGCQFKGTKDKRTERKDSSSSEISSDIENAPLSTAFQQKKKTKQVFRPKTSTPRSASTSSSVKQKKGKQLITPKTPTHNSASTSSVIEKVHINSSEDSEDSIDLSVSVHSSTKNMFTKTQRARMEIEDIKKVISKEKPSSKRKKKVISPKTKAAYSRNSGTSEEAEDSDVSSVSEPWKDPEQKSKKQKTKGIGKKVPKVKKRTPLQLKSKPSAPLSRGQNKKDGGQETDDDFVDEWDYNIKTIDKDNWVAVAYSNTFYIGQVEQKSESNVTVNFLIKKNEFYYWPTIPDRKAVEPQFIVCPKVNVNYEHRKYKVPDEGKISKAFVGFAKKYF